MLNFWKSVFSLKTSSRSSELPKKYIEILGFRPVDDALYWESLTPKALKKTNEKAENINYERLEFLGDAILGSIIAEYLYNQAPKSNEGYLTKMRAKIVSRKHLNHIGESLKLTDYIPFEKNNKVNLSSNVYGDLFEAMIGAIYKDQGYDTTKEFVNRVLIQPYVCLADLEQKIISYKSLILEWTQKNKKEFKIKTSEENNAENALIFVSELYIDDEFISKGRGYSKKKAEEVASKRAYYKFNSKI